MATDKADLKMNNKAVLYRKKDNDRSTGEQVFNVFNYLFFILFMLLCVYPFYYIFINTISDNVLSSRGMIRLIPQGIHFGNYVQVLQIPNIYNALLISVSRTVLGTLLTVLVSAFLGFMMTQRKMWLRTFVYRYFITTMYIGGGIIPVYLLFNQLGLLDNFLVYIIPGMVSAYNMILVKTYVESSIPDELQESAEMDGAGIGTVFFRIVLPLMLPILATLAIFSAVGQWNSFMDTVIYVTKDNLHTLQYVLYRYLSQATALANAVNSGAMSADQVSANIQTAQSIKLTVTMIVVIPIFMIYPFFQRFFVKGIMIGAVKG
ncbi:carbohydrate ABC transporter permease [Paenibacillus sp. HW567]|uniref:carbohydrate ABC transporter permease n=1 Tax=Paenibacillus sp. HW567 TaxID=1034769 RepID=UPI00036849C1|nr:carbohydrate ABC transporter permease [Paenibacillus sp. HW567]